MASIVSTNTSGVDWKSIIAGALAAAALSGVLITFGSALGLSMTSAHRFAGISITTLAILTGVWFAIVHVGCFAAGGYLTGRLANLPDTASGEAEFRTGANGFLVWALGTVVGLALLGMMAGTLTRSTANMATQAAGAVGEAASGLSAESLGYVGDRLLRASAAGTSAATSPPRPDAAQVAEVGRIVTVALSSGSLSGDDRTYLAQLVARYAGISDADAQRRIEEVVAQAQTMKRQAETRVREAADTARRQAVLAGFLAAAASLLGLVAAAWAAGVGREHQQAGRFPRVLAAERLW